MITTWSVVSEVSALSAVVLPAVSTAVSADSSEVVTTPASESSVVPSIAASVSGSAVSVAKAVFTLPHKRAAASTKLVICLIL